MLESPSLAQKHTGVVKPIQQQHVINDKQITTKKVNRFNQSSTFHSKITKRKTTLHVTILR